MVDNAFNAAGPKPDVLESLKKKKPNESAENSTSASLLCDEPEEDKVKVVKEKESKSKKRNTVSAPSFCVAGFQHSKSEDAIKSHLNHHAVAGGTHRVLELWPHGRGCGWCLFSLELHFAFVILQVSAHLKRVQAGRAGSLDTDESDGEAAAHAGQLQLKFGLLITEVFVILVNAVQTVM